MIPIDLRSDTVTRPTPAMIEAMFAAKIGDDVYGEDESINILQEKIAQMFGFEDALFCPSGTMTNQIAIRVLTQPQDEVICYKGSHIYKYEGGGLFSNSLVSVKLIEGNRGKITSQDVLNNINADDVHYPVSKLVALENTVNRGGGSTYTLAEIAEIHQTCQANSLKLHLDGARIFNALLHTGDSAKEYGKYFDTVSVCLSKGLGCPVGSLLLGNKAIIKQAKRYRKSMGGGMRQAGFLAAAGIYALDNHIERLKDDHQKAKVIEKHLQTKSFIKEVLPVETNIILFDMPNQKVMDDFKNYLLAHKIQISVADKLRFRIVTHLDFDGAQLERLIEVLDWKN